MVPPLCDRYSESARSLLGGPPSMMPAVAMVTRRTVAHSTGFTGSDYTGRLAVVTYLSSKRSDPSYRFSNVYSGTKICKRPKARPQGHVNTAAPQFTIL